MNFKNFLCVSVATGYNLPNVVIPLHFKLRSVCFIESKDAAKKNYKEGAVKILEKNGIEILESLTFPNDKADNLSSIEKLINYEADIIWNITGGQKIHTYKIFEIFYERKGKYKDLMVYHDRDDIVIIDAEGERETEKINLDLPLEDILEINNYWITNKNFQKKNIDFDKYSTPKDVAIFINNKIVRKIVLLWVNLYFAKRKLKERLSKISPAFLEVFETLRNKNGDGIVDDINKSIRASLREKLSKFSFILRAFKQIEESIKNNENEKIKSDIIDELKNDLIVALNKNIDEIVNLFRMDWKILERSLTDFPEVNEFKEFSDKEFPEGFYKFEIEEIDENLEQIGLTVKWNRSGDRYFIENIENVYNSQIRDSQRIGKRHFNEKIKSSGLYWGFFYEKIVLESIMQILREDESLKNNVSKIYTGISFANKNNTQADIECDILIITKSAQLIVFEVKTEKVEKKTVWTADNITTHIGGPFKQYFVVVPWFKEYGDFEAENTPKWVDKRAIIERLERLKSINTKTIQHDIDGDNLKKTLRGLLK